MTARRVVLAAPFVVSACALFRRRPPPPPVVVRYQVGAPYQAGGVWRYPRESLDYDATGLAQAFGAHGVLCSDGAPYDPAALIAAHPTLQLPCVAAVTNLQTGLQVVLRIDDRGPASPARLLALTPRAMQLLGPGSDPGVLRVRVAVLAGPSRTLAETTGAPQLAIAAAPQTAVQQQSLPPPPGAAGQGGAALAAAAQATVAFAAGPAVPLRLPDRVVQVPLAGSALYIDLGAFGHAVYASELAARFVALGAAVSTDYAAAAERPFRVRIGPLATAADSDATLDQVLRAGVVDARIVVGA